MRKREKKVLGAFPSFLVFLCFWGGSFCAFVFLLLFVFRALARKKNSFFSAVE